MSITALWLPILVSAALVFVVSAIIWMVMPWHKSDFMNTRDEDGVRAALRGNEPGYYMLPYVIDRNEFKRPEVAEKYREGPLAFITVIPNGLPAMGPRLVMSFLYYVVVGTFCAYFVSRSAGPDSSYISTFGIAATAAYVAYGAAYFQESIWFGRPWTLTAKNLLDALIYGLITGGTFGWLAT